MYRVNSNFDDWNTLKEFGFYKTEPSEINPWWQTALKVEWGSSMGAIKEGISINKNTNEVKIVCEHDAYSLDLITLLSNLVDHGVIEYIEQR